MNIDFNILWIDDDDDFTESLQDDLLEAIISLNLVPNIETHKDYSLDKARRIGNKYDLVLVDYNLTNDKVGTEIISKIRKSAMLPDIIFYSSVSTINEIITREQEEHRESLLDILQKGIYFCNSHNLLSISQQVIKKVITREEKINGFRGIVLSFVSDYESNVNDILEKGLDKLVVPSSLDSYIENDILRKMHDDSKKKYEEFQNDLNLSKAKEMTNADNRHLDHSKRVRIMCRILQELGYTDFDFDNYNCNVIKLRNSLGHISVVQDGENEYYNFFFDGQMVQLTPDYCANKRKELLSWKEAFKKIIDYLASK